ncbi:MAG: ABC transporter substrate-binding protein [Burkholderiales bacterium]|nr:ABC transporter substrate-binding protein [Burkholderiales bacterium]
MFTESLRKWALAAVVALAGLQAAPVQAESVLRLANDGDITQLDPLFSTAYPVRDMSYLIWDTLFSMDSTLTPRPQMVDTYSISKDGLTYSFTLRPKLQFSDGARVTSKDVIASIERWMTKDSLGMEIAKRMASLSAVDDNTFKLVLKQPFAQVLNGFGRMTAYPLFIMPEREAKMPIGKLTEWVGSGPYKLVKKEWIPGVKFVLEKNKSYVPRSEPPDNLAGGHIAGVDRIERIVFPDPNSAANALLAGEIDYITLTPTEMMPIFARSGKFESADIPLPGSSLQIVPNHTLPPFNNVKVRQALQYAVNQTDLMTAMYGNRPDIWRPCAAIFMCGGPYETDVNSARYMHQDFAKARALLKEAGYDGTPVLYMHPMDTRLQNEGGTVLVQAMRKAGFVVKDEQMDTATMFTRRANKGPVSEGGWNLFITAFNGDAMQDPLTNPYVTGACAEAFVGWPCDKQLQGDWQDFLLAANPAARKAAAVKIQDRANEIVTFIPGGQFTYVSTWSKKLSGIVKANVVVYWNITKKD